jgi:hypothetical protein
MTTNLYQSSVPAFLQMLNSLSSILTKAVAHAEAKKIDPAVLVNARLAPDMYPLARQIQSVSDSAKGAAARLAGVDVRCRTPRRPSPSCNSASPRRPSS